MRYHNLYNKTRHSYIYLLPIAGQTAGLIGLTFFADTHGWPGGVISEKARIFLFFYFIFPRATPGPSASLLKRNIAQN